MSAEARRCALVALGLGLLVVALRAPLMDLPLERDEAGYAYIAWRMAEGEVPYRDWFDQKPPGIFVAYAMGLALADDPALGIRGVAALFCAASAIGLFFVVRALAGTTAGLLAGVLLAFLSADPMIQGPIANTELFMTPWILLATGLCLGVLGRPRAPVAASLAVGAALGVATAFKQVAVLNAPFFVAIYALRAVRPGALADTLRFTGWLAAGGALVWAAILAAFWWADGLGPALDAVLLHNLDYAAQLTPAQRLGQLGHYVPPLLPSQGAAWVLALVGAVVLAVRGDRFAAIFLGGFTLANALGASVSGLYFPHYFQQVLPALAGLAAAGLVSAAPHAGPVRRAGLAAGAALALAPLAVAASGFWRLDPGEAMRRIYPGSAFEAMPAIAAELEALTAPDDSIFIFGAEPELLLGARRVSASRYIYLFPVFGDFPDAEARQAGVIEEVSAAQPAVIVWIPNNLFYAPGSPQTLTEWTTRYVDEGYVLHAFVVADRESRGTLHRVEPGSDPAGLLARARPWATLFRRAGPAPGAGEGT